MVTTNRDHVKLGGDREGQLVAAVNADASLCPAFSSSPVREADTVAKNDRPNAPPTYIAVRISLEASPKSAEVAAKSLNH